jgi:outer membrane protein TolC
VLELETTSSEAGARMTLPLGTELTVSVEAVRTKTNSTFTTLVPQYDAVGQIEIRQPLLAGFGPAAHDGVAAAEQSVESAQAQRDDTLLAVEATAEMTYWDLYAAVRDYAVQQIIYDRARRLVVEAETRARVGLVGPDEVANARVFLAEQEQAVLDQQQRLDGISDQLASLMGRRPEAGEPRFLAVEDPPREIPVEDQDALVTQALHTNLALQSAERDVESLRARERGAHWDALPQLDLFATLGGNGLSGTGQEVTFGGQTFQTDINGGYGDALGQVLGRDYPAWSAGVEFSLPIFRREGVGERDRLRAEVARSEQRYLATARNLEQRVRAGHRELANGKARLEAARRGVDASQEQVRIGLLEFSNGQVTAFELVRLGADLAAAQQRYSQALVRTAKAQAEIRYLTSAGRQAAPEER